MQQAFDGFREWLSFADSLWGVLAAMVAMAAFLYRRLRRERRTSAAALREFADQLRASSDDIERLEAERVALEARVELLQARDLCHCVECHGARVPLELEDLKRLRESLEANELPLAQAATHLARAQLEAFHVAADPQRLVEAHRLLSAAAALQPGPSTDRLRSEVSALLAASGAASPSGKDRETLWQEALDLLYGEGEADAEARFKALTATGTRLRTQGALALAGTALLASYRVALRAFGEDGEPTRIALNNVATNLMDRQEWAQARLLYLQLAEQQERLAGFRDEEAFKFLLAVAACDRELAGDEAALPRFEALVREGRDRFGQDNRWVLKAQNSLAAALRGSGRVVEAEALYEDTIRREVRLFGADHVNPMATRTNLVALKVHTGRHEEARLEARELLARMEAHEAAAHPMLQQLQTYLREVAG